MAAPASSSAKRRKGNIDLSSDSPTVFTTRRDPLRTPSTKSSELPMSSPDSVRSMHASQTSVVGDFPDFLAASSANVFNIEKGSLEEHGERDGEEEQSEGPGDISEDEVGDGETDEEDGDTTVLGREDRGTPEAEIEARADDEAAPGISNHPPSDFAPMWDGVEDISETQWEEAEITRERRKGSEKTREPITDSRDQASSLQEGSSSAALSPKLAPALIADHTDQSSQTRVQKPHRLSLEEELDAIPWSSSPVHTAKRSRVDEGADDEEEAVVLKSARKSAKKKRIVVQRSSSPEEPLLMRSASRPRRSSHAEQAETRRNGVKEEKVVQRDTQIRSIDAKNTGSESTTNAAAGPSLHDLFAGDEAHDLGPPAEIYEDPLTEQDEYDQFDQFDEFDFPDLDLDDLDAPGPSTTPLRPSKTKANTAVPIANFQSSPIKPPACPFPIMMIADLPPTVQDFYLNHWRRGADKVTKKKRAADDDEDSEIEGFGVKETIKPGGASRGFRCRGGWGFRGRARGGRGRARGRGGARGR